jgi:hypothetical protein
LGRVETGTATPNDSGPGGLRAFHYHAVTTEVTLSGEAAAERPSWERTSRAEPRLWSVHS